MKQTLFIVVDMGIHGENPVGGGQLARLELIKHLKKRVKGLFVFITKREDRLAELAREIYDETLIVDYVFFTRRRDHFQFSLNNIVKTSRLLIRASTVLKGAIDGLVEKHGSSRVIVFPNENYSRVIFSLIKLRGWRRYSGIMVIDNEFNRFKIDNMLVALYKLIFDKLIATSRAIALPFRTSCKKVSIIYPGIDIDKIRDSIREDPNRRAHDEGRFSIALIGSLLDIKRPSFALEILHRLVHVEKLPATMHVVGDGVLLEYLKDVSAGLNLTEHEDVIFWGQVQQGEVFRILEQADVLLHVSTTESFGRVIVEAQAAGKPVVVARTASSPEIIDDGATGFLVDKDDTEGFVDKLKTLAQDRQLRLKMGENATLFARKFDTKITADRYADIFQKHFGVELENENTLA